MAQTDFFKIGQAAYGGGADVSKAIGEGLKELRQSFTTYLYEWQKKEKAWKESIAPKLAKIGEDYNPSLVDESQRAAMTAALQESRLKYADILKQVRNMDPTSEEYINLMGQATDIVSGFDTTFKSAQEFSKLGNEYALAAQKPNGLSRGMTVEKRAALGKIFVEKDYTFERDPITGEMSYTINSNAIGKDGEPVNIKGLKISQDELDDFRLPNQESVNKYLAQNETFSELGKKGEKLTTESAKYKSATFQLQKELSNLDIEDLRSLALDPFVEGMPVAILSENSRKNIYDLTKEELAAELQNGMMTNLLATNQRDYKAPTVKITPSKLSDEEEAQKFAEETFNRVIKNPTVYASTYLPGAFVKGKGNIVTLTIDDKPKRFDLKRGDQFMEFMNLVTEESDELSNKTASGRAAKGKFYDLIFEARKILNERQEGFERMQEQLMPQFYAPFSQSDLPVIKE